MEESLGDYFLMCILDIMEREELEMFWKQGIVHALWFSFLCNLLMWIRIYIDGGSLTMLDFIDWLRSTWRGGWLFVSLSFLLCFLGFFCIQPVYFVAPLGCTFNIFILFSYCSKVINRILIHCSKARVLCELVLLYLVWCGSFQCRLEILF